MTNITTTPAVPTDRSTVVERLTRPLAAVVLVHGFSHLVGTTTAFQQASDGETAHYLGGLWEITDPTLLRTMGILWAIIAGELAAVAVLIWSHRGSWATALTAGASISLALTILGSWTAVIGVFVNLGLLAVAIGATRRTATPRRAEK
jgi:mannitol-specific phosphotransferase system IIBC component